MRWSSSHARSRGPRVSGSGAGSRTVRWMVPAVGGSLRFTGMMVLVELEEKETGDGGDGGLRRAVWGEAMRVRLHSFNIVGIEAAGSIAGSENAWMEAKMLDAYGSRAVAKGTQSG